MGALTKLQLFTKHLQYMGLLKKIDIPWPDKFFSFLNFADIFNIDFTFFYDLIDGLPPISFRIMFIAIAILFPLALMVITLLVFVSLQTIQWACTAIIGLFLVVVMIVFQSNPDLIPSQFHDTVGSDIFMGLAISMLGLAILSKAGSKLAWRWKFHEGPLVFRQLVGPGCVFCGGILAQVSQIMLKLLLILCAVHLSYATVTAQLLPGSRWGKKGAKGFIVLALLGGACYFVVKVNFDPRASIPDEMKIVGGVLLALGLIGFVQHLLFTKSSSGVGKAFVKARVKIQTLLDTGLLSLAFFSLGAAFVPVVTFCLEFFLCNDYSCPLGSKFNPFAPRPQESYRTDQNMFCDNCGWKDHCRFSTAELCPDWDGQRLLLHPDTPCDDEGHILFLTGGTIVLAVFVFIFTIMYHKIITVLTGKLKHRADELYTTEVEQYKKEAIAYPVKLADHLRLVEMLRQQHEQEKMLAALTAQQQAQQQYSSPHHHQQSPQGMLVVPSPGSPSHGYQPPSVSNQQQRHVDPLDDDFDPILHDPSTPSRAPQAAATVTKPRSSTVVSIGGTPQTTRPRAESFKPPPPPKKPIVPQFDVIFDETCSKSEPKASSLYQPYTYRFRFFGLIDQTFRLAVVLANVIMSPFSRYAVVVNFVLHTFMVTGLLAYSPYSDSLEQKLAAILAVCDVINALYGVMIWIQKSTFDGDEIAITLIVFNVFIPLVAGIVLQILSIRNTFNDPRKKEERKKKKEAEKKRKAERKVAEELEKLLKEDEDDEELREMTRAERRKAEMEREEKEKPPEVRLTEDLNDNTKGIVMKFFVYFCVPLLLISMGLTMFATLQADEPEFVESISTGAMFKDHVLLGLDSWEVFTDRCCAFEARRPNSGANLTERWVCATFNAETREKHHIRSNDTVPLLPGGKQPEPSGSRTVTRNRITSESNNGLPLRGLGMKNFTWNCTVEVAESSGGSSANDLVTLGAVSLSCDPDPTKHKNVSSYALKVLW